ncbi:MAG: hypothetical protein RIQ30_1502, partial [Pseudomonadota bacterium]
MMILIHDTMMSVLCQAWSCHISVTGLL